MEKKTERVSAMLKKVFDKTFLKFILVGIANTLFGTMVMFVFYNFLHFNYWISSASNYILGSILSYFLNRFFTFESKENSAKTIWKFAINISVCYLVAYGIAKPIAGVVFSGISIAAKDNISMLIGMCLFVGLNYLGQRFIVFKK